MNKGQVENLQAGDQVLLLKDYTTCKVVQVDLKRRMIYLYPLSGTPRTISATFSQMMTNFQRTDDVEK